MLKQRVVAFLKKFYPFLLLVPFILLVLFLTLSTFARGVVIDPAGNPFPEGSKYVDDQIIVKYKGGQTPEEMVKNGDTEKERSLAASLLEMGVTSQKKLFTSVNSLLNDYYLLILKPGTNIPNLYNKLLTIPEIDSITPDYILTTLKPGGKESSESEKAPEVKSPPLTVGEPDDPYFLDGQQWDMKAIDMEKAWDLQRANSSVTVAVVDTGVDYNHPDLLGKIIKGRNYIANSDDPLDDHGHGTHVAGTVVASTNNKIGISSVSWGAKVLAIKACDGNGDCLTSNVVQGISYALERGVKIINISIAGVGSCKRENFFSGDRVYEDVIKDAEKKGAIIVVAAGNHNQNAAQEVPGACEGVFTVGATNSSNARWLNNDSSGSNFGNIVDIAAPGSPILSTTVQNGYSIRNGTSMAAPHVSGAAALLLSFNKNLSADQVRTCLTKGAQVIQTDKHIGSLLNTYNSLIECGAAPRQDISSPSVTVDPQNIIPTLTLVSDRYTISGTVFIDGNADGILSPNEKTLGGVQVILSPAADFTSVLANPQGYFLFNNLTPETYLVSISIPGVSSVNLPTSTVTLSEISRSATVNIPVSPVVIPTSAPLQNGQITAPSPTSTQQVSSGCYYDPGCFENGNSGQACSFKCF